MSDFCNWQLAAAEKLLTWWLVDGLEGRATDKNTKWQHLAGQQDYIYNLFFICYLDRILYCKNHGVWTGIGSRMSLTLNLKSASLPPPWFIIPVPHSCLVDFSMHLCPVLLLSMPLSFLCRAAHMTTILYAWDMIALPLPHTFSSLLPFFLWIPASSMWTGTLHKVCVCLGDILTEINGRFHHWYLYKEGLHFDSLQRPRFITEIHINVLQGQL